MNKFYLDQIENEENRNGTNIQNNTPLELNVAYLNSNSKTKTYSNAILDLRIIVFIIGFSIGMLLLGFALGNAKFNSFQLISAAGELKYLNNYEIEKEFYLTFVLKIRIRQLLFLFLCSISFFRTILAYILIGFSGVGFGLITFSCLYQYGLRGMLLTIGLSFPQLIFYVMIFFIIFDCLNNCRQCSNHIKEKKFFKLLNNLKKILIILFLFVFGVLSEVYINLEVLKKIVSIL